MRRIPLSRHSHVTGFRPVDGEAVEHESERDFVLWANFLDAGAAITSQPIKIEFQDGAWLRRYTPDFPRDLERRRSRIDCCACAVLGGDARFSQGEGRPLLSFFPNDESDSRVIPESFHVVGHLPSSL